MIEQSISIIGTGALGCALARSLNESVWPVKSLFNRTLGSVKNLAEEMGVQEFGNFPSCKQELGRIIFLTVPDRAIEETAQKLSDLDDDFLGYLVAHCSGNKPSSILKVIGERGAQIASFHPIQTFVSSSVANDFEGIYIDIEGQDEAVKVLYEISDSLGSNILEITQHAKPYLHAASVMASNYVVALMECAGKTAAMGGLDKKEVHQALLPLMQKSVANLSKSDNLPESLSGPVARGDVTTVADHLKLLQQDERLLTLYKKLGEVLVQMLNKKGEMSTEKVREMTDTLSDL